jgi:hypothetical protein
MRDPVSLVEGRVRHYGRFASRPANVNPLDEFGGPLRALRSLRLKEWVGFTLSHPDLYSSMIIQDAHYLSSSEIYAYDRERGALHQHARNGRGGALRLPAKLAGSHCVFAAAGYRLEYEFGRDGGAHRVRFDIAASKTAAAFAGDLTLHPGQASPPLSVSSRLPGGRMYTHKAIYPASGTVRIGDEEFVFEADRDLAILDEHKSLLPYRTRWLWGTFGLHTDAGLVGANFVERPSVAGQEDESCVWTPAAAEPLADLRFEPASADPKAAWHVASRDGRLDVTFEPEGRKQVHHQLGLFSIDYFQLFGSYRGAVRGAGGVYEFDGVHGVCESMRARL